MLGPPPHNQFSGTGRGLESSSVLMSGGNHPGNRVTSRFLRSLGVQPL